MVSQVAREPGFVEGFAMSRAGLDGGIGVSKSAGNYGSYYARASGRIVRARTRSNAAKLLQKHTRVSAPANMHRIHGGIEGC